MNTTDKSYMFLQFGAGHRACLGKNISYLEIYKLVPTMLRKYEVSGPLIPQERRTVLSLRNVAYAVVQISFADPARQEWIVKNRWLTHQSNFNVTFRQRVVD